MTYKKLNGYSPGVASIGDLIVGKAAQILHGREHHVPAADGKEPTLQVFDSIKPLQCLTGKGILGTTIPNTHL